MPRLTLRPYTKPLWIDDFADADILWEKSQGSSFTEEPGKPDSLVESQVAHLGALGHTPMVFHSHAARSQHSVFKASRYRALDSLHLILVSHTVYSYTITNFGNVPALLKPTW